MTEDEARAKIVKWAKGYFSENHDNVIPQIKIVSIAYDEYEEEWTAELEVSTSADNPHVTFFVSDEPGHGLQVQVEY